MYVAHKHAKERLDDRTHFIGPKVSKDASKIYPEIKGTRCHIWLGYLLDSGYGRICYKRRNVMVHRFAYELTFGKIPKGKIVLHKCDTKSCRNELHLRVGTHSDNTLDKVKKNRQSHGDSHSQALRDRLLTGENSPRAIFSDRDIEQIRFKYASGNYTRSMLSKRYKVTYQIIDNIVKRRTYVKKK